MSASNSAGIQTLLEAERKAQEIVQEARSYRTQRVKAAKTDAAAEVEEYKAKKEAELKNSTTSDEISDEKSEAIAVEASKAQIEDLQKQAASHKDNVLKFLVEQATTAK